jgi:hypothetical protein
VTHPLAGKVNFLHVAHDDREVRPISENCAHGLSDIHRGQPRGRHLIKQGLEEVMILSIDDSDPRQIRGQILDETQSGKSRSNYDNVRE